jgi:hypothetical protein
MKIKVKIEISGENADLSAIPLIQDNTDTMKTVLTAESAVTSFESNKIGSVLASVDDYLMNAKVAEDIVNLAVDGDDERE